MSKKTNTESLEFDAYYHIYNRGVAGGDIFQEHDNYLYFLNKYAEYASTVFETYSYCLLRNHFHFFIKVKSAKAVPDLGTPSALSQRIGTFFNVYAQSFNKRFGRTGPLFESPFRRIRVDDDSYFTAIIRYIHHNPVKHKTGIDFRHYPYSSYPALLSLKSTKLMRKEVLDWFGGKDAFINAHELDDSQTHVNPSFFLDF